MWARGRCRISPPRFLAECCKRQLNQGSFVLLYIRFSTFSDLYWVCLSIFLYLFVCQYQSSDWLWRPPRNDLYCVDWGVKLCSIQLFSYHSKCFSSPSEKSEQDHRVSIKLIFVNKICTALQPPGKSEQLHLVKLQCVWDSKTKIFDEGMLCVVFLLFLVAPRLESHWF